MSTINGTPLFKLHLGQGHQKCDNDKASDKPMRAFALPMSIKKVIKCRNLLGNRFINTSHTAGLSMHITNTAILSTCLLMCILCVPNLFTR